MNFGQYMNFYELIVENTPCRLHFDVEYKAPGVEHPLEADETTIPILLECIGYAIVNAFPMLEGHVHPDDFMILYSDTPEKYSCHIIWAPRRVDVRFKNSGHIIHWIDNYLMDHRHTHQEVNYIDRSIYTKNRNFRLLGSHKYGKPVWSKLSTTLNTKEAGTMHVVAQYQEFTRSLVCPPQPTEDMNREIITSPFFDDNTTHGRGKLSSSSSSVSSSDSSSASSSSSRSSDWSWSSESSSSLVPQPNIPVSHYKTIQRCQEYIRQDYQKQGNHGIKVLFVKCVAKREGEYLLASNYMRYCVFQRRLHSKNNNYVYLSVSGGWFGYRCRSKLCGASSTATATVITTKTVDAITKTVDSIVNAITPVSQPTPLPTPPPTTTTTLPFSLSLTDIKQGSDEWLEERKRFKATGSVLAEYMGISPYTSQHQAARIFMGLEKRQFSPFSKLAMEHGKREEPNARRAYEEKTGNKVYEKGMYQYAVDPRFAASPDGVLYVDSPKNPGSAVVLEGVLEVKCPFAACANAPLKNGRKPDALVKAASIPLHYLPQLYANMAFSGAKWCDYVSYVSGELLWIARVNYDEEVWQFIYNKVVQFIEHPEKVPARNINKSYTEYLLRTKVLVVNPGLNITTKTTYVPKRKSDNCLTRLELNVRML
ncbi:hypothetical protein SAMD00019534_125680 [Acytostelium subglobosum LB1]|uniref:hypothetical protein n=1 Tax=Acytostelium subglobosum LB1 TaxID=1410327 RepID=UPI000644ACA2|nr:hypothetical protein SAMD00019534_125680 [Acytostelium subglobosum LB1]GAM29392.1 hypothetical protein SAMD00019534_125680 [Acytostelium subglobosum LB1]|eukprot:XP_012747660.1 hypothetical protein SAMD00019534_125680 [Acytostelium subglobosum LB1]